jgi:hypothetical protein
MIRLTRLARRTPPALQTALPSLAALLAAAWVQVGQSISPSCGAAGPQGTQGGEVGLQSLLPERAGPLLRALIIPRGMQQARFVSLACWHAGGMASRSRDALPVLEERYERAVNGRRPCNRPRVCGVAGCAEPLVNAHHLRSRLCPAHMKCYAVLRRGEPQRWCSYCCKFHALKAFGSGRYAPPSRSERCAHPQSDSPLQMHARALYAARFQSA